jgi:opacity protein-like surface antigen
MAFAANADVAEEVVVAETAQSVFSSIYAGFGIGGSFLESNNIEYKDKDGKDAKDKLKANRFIGSFVLGGGKVFNNNVYAGAEFLMDFTKNKKKEWETNSGNGKLEGKVGGFVPQLNVRAGYVFKNNVLAYAKLGCAWTKASVKPFTKNGNNWDEVKGKSMSKTKAAFVLGLGAEKAFCKKFSAAVEADYNFGWKQKIADKNLKDEQDVRFNKGWNVRALVKYNVKY